MFQTIQKLNEIKLLIKNLDDSIDTQVKSDHIINLLETVDGQISKDKDKLLSVIEEFENLNEEDQKKYQLARRMGMVRQVSDMDIIGDESRQRVESILEDLQTPKEFEEVLGELISRYI